MPRYLAPIILSAFLAVTVAVGVAQRSEARALQARLAALETERDALRQREADLEQRNRDLATLLEAAQKSAPETGAEVAPRRLAVAAEGNLPGGWAARQQPNRFENLLNRPEVRELLLNQQKAGLDGRYAALFRKLGLSGEALEKFKNLLVQKQSTMAEVMMEARNQGLTGRENRDELRQLAEQLQAEADADIRAAIGESAYAQYKNYETTLPQRSVASQLEQRLSYSGSPLHPAQVDQLVQILHDTATANANQSRTGSTVTPVIAFAGQGGVFSAAGSTRITDAAIAQAKGILAPAQLEALQNLQREQQAAAQLAQQLRVERRNNAPANPLPPKG
jgi:hypothetical protein